MIECVLRSSSVKKSIAHRAGCVIIAFGFHPSRVKPLNPRSSPGPVTAGVFVFLTVAAVTGGYF